MSTALEPIVCAVVAAVVVVAMTPLVSMLARRIGAVDLPSGRRIHTHPTPRLGGLAIMLGVLIPTLFLLPVDSQARALLVGAALVGLIGAVDDIFTLDPIVKLVGQIACAAIPVSAGLTIDHITLPIMGVHNLGAMQYPITIVWFVAIVNMINFIDGMDGLAAGVAGLSAINFAILAASLGRTDPAVLAAAIAGACGAFLIFNFHPARVFMGDSGSMFLGFAIAGVAVDGVLKSVATVALFGPLLVLAIPILDTSFVIMRRIKHGKPVYQADRSHFHHRFFTIGWGQRKTVLAMYCWCALLGILALVIRFVPYRSQSGHIEIVGSVVLGVCIAIALGAALYLVYVLEILKWRNTPVVKLVRERSGEGPLSGLWPRRGRS